MGAQPPLPLCSSTLGPDWIDAGTLCRQRSYPPGPIGLNDEATSKPRDTVSRLLTLGEIRLAKTLFGDSINYTAVRIIHEKAYFFQPDNRAMAPDGNIYFSPRDLNYRKDFSTESFEDQGLFIHEMTHVWQHQSGVYVRLRGIMERTYEYDLAGSKDLADYNIEQQGEIIRDYFWLLHQYKPRSPSGLVNPVHTLALYKRVLANFLADPAYLKRR